VVVVDPDRLTREAVSDALSDHASEFRVRSLESAREAIEILTRERVDILVTALDMPEMDGFELIAFAMARRPEASVVVIGDHHSGRLREIMRSAESFYHLRRPVGPQQVMQLLRSLRPAEAAGHLQGLSLAGLLQMLAAEGKTCRVAVRSGHAGGLVELERGDIVHAECGNRRGRDAAFEMLSWPAPELGIQRVAGSRAETIRITVAELLIEAAWRWDEDRRAGRGKESGEFPGLEEAPKEVGGS
jgi:CheY-like chemotaxis protein